MDYETEDKEDKKYKKSYGRKEFKKDVAEAVKPELANLKKGRKKKTLWIQSRFQEYVRRLGGWRPKKTLERKKEGPLDQGRVSGWGDPA